ncbi:MAG: hypothetical protein PUA69_02015 [Erysipelotrichaceae bacterium]|nr:hypothetical protein [Erysipelotrichaceae bacterium]
MKKKKHHNKPMTHAARLHHARFWLEDPNRNRKKNIITSYRKSFHLEFQRAVKDLGELNVPLSEEVIKQAEKNEEERIHALHARKEKRKQKLSEEQFDFADENFSYIAGYTSNGVPYGTTWEEKGNSDLDLPDRDDFPF